MPDMNWQSSGNFTDRLWDFLKALEAPTLSAIPVNGNLTIGLGFDLRVGKAQLKDAVLSAMGLNISSNNAFEQDYVARLRAAFSGTDAAALNSIMLERFNNHDPAYDLAFPPSSRREEFKFNNVVPEVKDIYQAVLIHYLNDIPLAWPGVSFLNDLTFLVSRERLALASMVWNGGAGILRESTQLRAALIAGDRAEAWFEIRYKTNKRGSGVEAGIAKRRYAEAAMLGLYDNNVSQDEAKDAYRMLTRHRVDIDAYETKFGATIRADANTVVQQSGIANISVSDISGEFGLARDTFIQWLNGSGQLDGQPALTAGNWNAASIYYDPAAKLLDARGDDGKAQGRENNILVGSATSKTILLGGNGQDTLIGGIEKDTLEGGAGDDVLIGGAEKDTLTGGAGNDVLNGGIGKDTYVYNAGDGVDTIIDPDGGVLVVDGQGISFGGGTMTKDPGSNTWRDPTGNVVLSHQSPWQLTMPDGSTIQLGDAFDPAQWGIILQDPAVPATTPAVQAENPDEELVDIWGWQGNPNVALNFTGSVANELIIGGEAQDATGTTGDYLDGAGGDDFILGGRGRDVIHGGDGNDWIRGSHNGAYFPGHNTGLGLPVLLSANGWGLLDAGNGYYPLEWAYTGFGTPYTSGDDGNVIDGGAGNDDIEAGGGADVVRGGAGNDSIRGGGKDDTLYGDDGSDGIYGDGFDNGSTVIEVTTLAEHGADVIDGGSGEDFLVGQGKDDIVFGGADNDTLFGDSHSAGFPSASTGFDVLDGGDGDDYLDGGGKDDVLFGGIGNDRLYGDGHTSIVAESDHGSDFLDGEEGDDILVGDGGSDILIGGTGNDMLYGDASGLSAAANGNDFLDGGDGLDQLVGGGGNDLLFGGRDNDTLFGGIGNDVLDGGDGNDYLAGDEDNDTLTGGDGNDTLVAGIGDDSLSGNDGDDILFGGDGADSLDGDAGADYLAGGLGDDTYFIDNLGDAVAEASGGGIDLIQSTVSYTLASNVEQLTLLGTSAINATGNSANNVLTGNSFANVLTGLDGNDTYVVDNDADVVVEVVGQGIDLVQSSITYALGNDVENLTLTGISAIDGTGNALDNVLTGNSAANTLTGGAGNDTYVVDNVGDIPIENAGEGTDLVQSSITFTLASNLENLTLTGTSAINGTGNALDNVLTGNSAANTLTGGNGNDTYVIDNAGDAIVENGGEGIDSIQSSITYVLGSNVENLTLTGTSAINGTGNALDNVLLGNSAVNTLTGGAGNDTYGVNLAGDLVIENANEGIDLVQSSITFTLASNFENLTLTGTSSISGTGNALDNVLTGNNGTNSLTGGGGNDTLNGLAGADTLVGGTGNDTYVVDSTIEIVTENAGEGTDLVQASATYTLANNVENLTLTGSSNINGTGNTLNNILTGNTGNNTLSGAAGADTMIGGAGDDTYVVENAADVISENSNEGVDTVQSSISIVLASNVENLTLTGASAINGTGNALDNVLTGNSAVNALAGGAGNDTYVVDLAGDTVTENVGEGIDLVQSGVTYTLGSNVENLTLTGAAVINGTGNALDNVLTGNSAANALNSGDGNDTLIGGAGADTMTGGIGNDSYDVDQSGDAVIENASEGTDLVQSSATYVLSNNVENLTLTGSSAINGTGNALDNVLVGNNGTNTLTGGAGNDTYVVQSASDVIVENASEGTDLVQTSVTYTLSGNVENLTLTGFVAINGTGNALNNILTGNTVVNTLTGGAGDDTLDGGQGADTMAGGTENDTYVVDNAGDVVTESVNQGTDLVQSSITYGLSSTVENLTLTGSLNINGTGNSTGNTLVGNSGNNTLNGLGGADSMLGGDGNDTYVVDNAGDSVSESAGQGTDLVQSSVTFTVGSNVENLTLTGAAAINGTGNSTNNVLVGNSAINILTGGAGDDNYTVNSAFTSGDWADATALHNFYDTVTELGGEGYDTITASGVHSATLSANAEKLVIQGYITSGTVFWNLTQDVRRKFTGNALDNVIDATLTFEAGFGLGQTSTAGFDEGEIVIDGGAGADLMIGPAQNLLTRYIVDNVNDVVVVGGTRVDDRVQTTVSYTLASGVDYIDLVGSAAISGTGNAGNNRLDGSLNTAANLLAGAAGNDTYRIDAADTVQENAGEGNDTVVVMAGAIRTYLVGEFANVENLELGSSALGASNLTGNAQDNILRGNASTNTLIGDDGNDLLDGGGGADMLSGGNGNDVFVVDHASDQVSENATAGTDLVQSSISYSLTSNVENLTLTGTGAINGTGNALDNVLTGNSAVNTLVGGAGNDTYVLGVFTDVVTENANEGIDLVLSESDYTLANNVENLTLTDIFNINGTGNSLANTLTGNSGSNMLDGAAGIDTMIGGDGNDTYVVDNVGDAVAENNNQGTDLVQSSVTFTLASNIENLTLTGSAAINGTGNALDNILIGNGAANTLTGGAGNDTYLVDNVGDVVVESASEGTDFVLSSVSFTLAGNVENLTLTGSSAVNGTGNALNNVLVGNTAANLLTGGAGNDSYVIDNLGDLVVESANEGTDLVQSTVTFTLGNNVENLTLTGASAINGTGNSLANSITGNDGANVLDGGAGSDVLTGGAGNDTYVVDALGDVVSENAGEGTDSVQSSITLTLADNVEDLTLTGTSAIDGTGNSSANTLVGNAGSNTLDGGAGADTMAAGSGDDTYVVDNSSDNVTENLGEGTDLVESSVTYTLGSNVENLTLIGTSAIDGTGNALSNTLLGNSGDNTLSAGTGADTMSGGAGNDTYVVDDAGDVITEYAYEGTDIVQASLSYALGMNFEQLTLTGAASINGTGNAESNTITGNSADNILDGGFANDSLIGGAGNDTYIVDNTGDSVTEGASAGTDLVQSSVTFTLGSNVENLALTGASTINGTGNSLANILVGNSANNTLNGGTGTDTMTGGLGDDIYVIDNAGDVLVENTNEGVDLVQSSISYTLGSNVENLTLTGSSGLSGTGNALDNVLTGNSGANTLTGGAGNDTIDGGTGDDTMIGGTGDDSYVVNVATDVVTENANEGIDTVSSSAAFTLAANIENLTLTGSSGLAGTGNTLDNVLTGNSGANTLTGGAGNDTIDGGTGNDTMVGGTGDDIYFIGATGDVVTENASEGADTIQSSVTYTASANVENLVLTGSSAINATGNTLINILTGNSANNTLDGGAGADTLVGGAGNDTYVVDNAADVVNELAGEGTDTVQSGVSYSLGAEVENLTLTGAAVISGTGNALNNLLTGNTANNTLTGGAGNDTIDGGTGNDTMIGGTGDDSYVVNVATDVVTENAAEGVDTISSSVTLTLGSNVENLTLTGSSGLAGTGNTLDNVLTGNSGANTLTGGVGNDTLDGGTGNDTMIGGTGDDSYVVNVATDVVTENVNEGTDTVNSSATLTLGGNVENLTLTGTSASNGTGQALHNVLTGNTGVNTLTGLGGNDTLEGKAGNDTLVGGDGADLYRYSAGDGSDTINNVSADSAIDRLVFTNVVRTELTFARVGDNLIITRTAAPTDSIQVTNWFAATGNRVDFIDTSDGQSTTANDIDALINGGGGSFLTVVPSASLDEGGSGLWHRGIAFADLFSFATTKSRTVTEPIDFSAAAAGGMDIDRTIPSRFEIPALVAPYTQPRRDFAWLDDRTLPASSNRRRFVTNFGVENRFGSAIETKSSASPNATEAGAMRIVGGLADLLDISTAKGRSPVAGCLVKNGFESTVEADSPALSGDFGVAPIHVSSGLDDLMNAVAAKTQPQGSGHGIKDWSTPTVASDEPAAAPVNTSPWFVDPIRCGLQLDRFIHAMASFKKQDSFDSMSQMPIGDTLSLTLQGASVTPVREMPYLSRAE